MVKPGAHLQFRLDAIPVDLPSLPVQQRISTRLETALPQDREIFPAGDVGTIHVFLGRFDWETGKKCGSDAESPSYRCRLDGTDLTISGVLSNQRSLTLFCFNALLSEPKASSKALSMNAACPRAARGSSPNMPSAQAVWRTLCTEGGMNKRPSSPRRPDKDRLSLSG